MRRNWSALSKTLSAKQKLVYARAFFSAEMKVFLPFSTCRLLGERIGVPI
jgi:hypothetical protein